MDMIAEARRQWDEHGWEAASPGMATVTSVMRVHQILSAWIDRELAPYDLTFARYEVLRLLAFTRTGSLPLGKVGARLQVHPASVTNAVDRLEVAGLVRREPHPTDGRTVLATITPEGRRVVERATEDLNGAVFGALPLSAGEHDRLVRLLRKLRAPTDLA